MKKLAPAAILEVPQDISPYHSPELPTKGGCVRARFKALVAESEIVESTEDRRALQNVNFPSLFLVHLVKLIVGSHVVIAFRNCIELRLNHIFTFRKTVSNFVFHFVFFQ